MEESFARLLELMPDVTSLKMLLSQELDPNDYSSVVPLLLKTGQKFTNIRINFEISDQQVLDLVAAYSESLIELRLKCKILTPRAYGAIGMFRRESLFSDTPGFEAEAMQSLTPL